MCLARRRLCLRPCQVRRAHRTAQLEETPYRGHVTRLIGATTIARQPQRAPARELCDLPLQDVEPATRGYGVQRIFGGAKALCVNSGGGL